MAKNDINLSLQDELNAVGHSIAKVTKAIFAGNPGIAPAIPGKRKTAQVTFKIRGADDKNRLMRQARRQFLDDFMRKNGPKMEIEMKKAMKNVIAGLIGVSGANISVFGKSLGVAKPRQRIDDAPFAKFIKTAAGAGEIGLPDPNESIRNLKAALMRALTVDVLSRGGFSPQMKFTFDQNRLLKNTPHPVRKKGTSPFFSWLSLVTGPGFISGGTPGFGLVRVKDLHDTLKSSSSLKQGGIRSQRRVEITEGLTRLSRTRGNAGDFAGIMMRTTRGKGGRSPAEAFGGVTESYRPSPRFNGFWDKWWFEIKDDLGVWAKRIISATIRLILRGRNG